ncbi:glycosyltransferase family 2 protein [Candidatus Bipolaricaulota bacterium]|nr:glycosyltransferase family 2 protein [Candidatus Bipolaricaulota bacterium]
MIIANYFIDTLLILYSLYFLAFVILGWRDNDLFGKSETPTADPESKFAVFVPAHNEEKVISKLLQNLQKLDYPSHLYDIFVIADNCQDKTANVASIYDVNVLERTNEEEKGKGYALQYGFQKVGIIDGSSDYDAVAIFDADNLVKENFLRVMNTRLLGGEKLIQAYVDSKNPVDNWVTATFSMMFWINDRYALLSRYNVGMSAVLMGTGMCISTNCLSKTGWQTRTLTEDLEYSIQALIRGTKTSFSRDTRVFDEKPVTFSASCRQRLRWARGQLSVISNYVPRLLYRAFKEKNLIKLDGALRLFQAPFIMFYFLVTVLRWTLPGLFAGPIFHYVLSNVKLFAVILPLMPFIIPASLFIVDKLPEEAFKYVILFPVFTYSWIAILYWGLATLNKTEWLHTNHFRNLSKEDLKIRKLASTVHSRSVEIERAKSLALAQPTKTVV